MVCKKHWKWQSALKGSQNSYFCFLSFCFQIHNQCLYTYTVRTFIIMSEMKICIIFPSNGLYIIPLPLSASVQAHAKFVQPKRIPIIHCTLETQIQLHSVSKLDIALVFFPGLSTPALQPRSVSQVFFFFNFWHLLPGACGATPVTEDGNYPPAHLRGLHTKDAPAGAVAASSCMITRTIKQPTTCAQPTTRRRAVAPLERFGRGEQKKSSPGLQRHPPTFTCARTCAGWSASWRARRLRWCHDWLPVQAVMSRYLWTACFPRCPLPAGKSLCRSVFFPFYSFNLTTVRQSWDKTKFPTGALRVRMSSSLGLGRP